MNYAIETGSTIAWIIAIVTAVVGVGTPLVVTWKLRRDWLQLDRELKERLRDDRLEHNPTRPEG